MQLVTIVVAVAAEIAVVRGKMLAVATAVLHMAEVPTAVVTRTVVAPPAIRAALAGIATVPFAAALAGLAVEIAAAIPHCCVTNISCCGWFCSGACHGEGDGIGGRISPLHDIVESGYDV